MAVKSTSKVNNFGRKRHNRHREVSVQYVIEVCGWEWNFLFGVSNAPHLSGGPYGDYRHLKIQGRLVSPSKLRGKEIELNFLPNEKLNIGHRQNDKPIMIGHLSFRRNPSALISMPADVLPCVLSMLIAEKFRYVVLIGPNLRFLEADVRSFQLMMQIAKEDFPED